MKQLKLILITAITFLMIPCYGMVTGVVTQTTQTFDMASRSQLNYVIDQQNYTTGGATFTYPVGWFTQPPFIQIAVIQNIPHSTNETFGAEVSTNSAGSTTIMVYQVSFGVVSEAPDSSITVCLLAVANPV